MTHTSTSGQRASRPSNRAAGVLLFGLLLAGTDIALQLARVKTCNSVATSRCLGGLHSHGLLLAGVVALLTGWGLATADAGKTQPLARATVRFALLLVPVIATIGDFVGEDILNPSDSAWDGRPIPIRLAILVVGPAALTLTAGAVNRGRMLPVLGTTALSVATSYVLPFALAIVALVASSSWMGAVLLLAALAIGSGLILLRRRARRVAQRLRRP